MKKTLKQNLHALLRCLFIYLPVIIELLFSLKAYALETINVVNNASVQAVIGKNDFNRIFVTGDRIMNVMGTPSAYLIQTDNILGQVYIKPLQNQPFNLTLTTERGSVYQLKCIVRQSTAETINLQPPVMTPEQAQNWESETPYETTLTRLIRAMATGAFPDGYQISFSKNKNLLPLGSVATVTLISQYLGASLEGDIYLIQNLTSQPLNLTPQQLYREGAMAIALQSQSITPKGQTRLFIVKEGAHDE